MNNDILEKIFSNQHLLKAVLSSSTNGIAIADAKQPGLPIVFINDTFCKITGYSKEEVIGKNCKFLQGEKTSREASDMIREAIQKGREVGVVLINYKKNGAPFLNNLTIIPIRDENQEIVFFLGLQRDISYKLEMQTINKDRDAKIRLAETYKNAVERAAIVSYADTKGVITEVNDEFCAISGYTREELIGQPHNIVRHPDMPKEFFKQMWDAIKAKKIWRGKVTNRKKNGDTYIVYTTIVPMLDEQGEIEQYLSIRFDITEATHLFELLYLEQQENLRKEHEHAVHISKVKDDFLGIFSHELKTPLNAVISFSEFALKKLNNETFDKSEVVQYVEVVYENSEQMREMINSILEILRIKSKKVEFHIAALDVYELLSTLIHKHDRQIKKRGVTVELVADRLAIHSDYKYLSRAVEEIFTNAIKNCVSKVTLKAVDGTDGFCIEIEDDGYGIKDKKNIFESFEQDDGDLLNRGIKGLGLGLSIVKLISDRLGLSVNVVDASPRGSIFQIKKSGGNQ